MGYVLSANTSELLDEFLEAERPKVSAQGYTMLAGTTRRVMQWFDDEELEGAEVRITDAVRLRRRCRSGLPMRARRSAWAPCTTI